MVRQVTSQLLLDLELRPDATFANFLGEVPRELRVETPWAYCWGPLGTGRSHLLQAFCHAWQADHRQVMYLPSPARTSPEMLDNLHQYELLCIDEADDVLQDEAWQAPLFHLFNSLKDNGHALLMSGLTHPLELHVPLADLRSRFRAMSHVESSELDQAGKTRLLQQRASRHGFQLSEQVVDYVMNRCARDQQTLLRVLDGLAHESLRQQRRVTIPLVREMLNL
ncbi:MAG: DnaA regulatory inactivator Hda [Gammaproteobacteria bacterium]|uniref:DnaA regulatory inactivator Hda n=1 Tax=OM182 bacterium MED-G24 TaxID=1986255 RepID=A0A2A5WV87_9GAMM|nr:DnaA regulatory inactivator Hda [Gammaproteobacteria bacterium]PDH40137.1 MAG: DnaA regulatory inactivator Hda [OM182 bacterium MED-G24]RPG26104.1 MAG: DnaA regulatory inactivator Hda [Gammaproteobacteria bacterium TMED50]